MHNDQADRGHCKRLPCLRLLTPSAGSGEGALSLTEDMVGVPLTSFVQIGHDSALFESPAPVHFKASWANSKTIAEDNATNNEIKKQKCREVEGLRDRVFWWRLTWMRRSGLCKKMGQKPITTLEGHILGNCLGFDISYSHRMAQKIHRISLCWAEYCPSSPHVDLYLLAQPRYVTASHSLGIESRVSYSL
jgi:hypothetical protein